MIFITSIFNLPLLIVIWLIEAYVFLAVARLILANISMGRQSSLYRQVKSLTDPIPDLISQHLGRVSSVSVPFWLPWVIVMLFLCFIRQILVWIVIS
jgi:hypothetical protein